MSLKLPSIVESEYFVQLIKNNNKLQKMQLDLFSPSVYSMYDILQEKFSEKYQIKQFGRNIISLKRKKTLLRR